MLLKFGMLRCGRLDGHSSVCQDAVLVAIAREHSRLLVWSPTPD